MQEPPLETVAFPLEPPPPPVLTSPETPPAPPPPAPPEAKPAPFCNAPPPPPAYVTDEPVIDDGKADTQSGKKNDIFSTDLK